MVATSSGRGNEAFLERYGLDASTPDNLGDALERTYKTLTAADLFFGHGSDSAWDESVFLVLSAASLPLNSSDAVLGEPLSEDVWRKTLGWIRARIVDRKPLPYITGRAWFAGLEFNCDERALVPRSPLAELICNGYQPWLANQVPRRLLDLCCGGGCIGIAAAVHDESLEVVIADIDTEALALAKENIARYHLENRVRCQQSDLLDALRGERFDIILCNPPYVDAEDLSSMPAEFHSEPPLGLGSGVDGLELARQILCQVSEHLTPGGLLFLELGNSWEALDKELANLTLNWVEFAQGGHGVLVLRSDELPAIARQLRLA